MHKLLLCILPPDLVLLPTLPSPPQAYGRELSEAYEWLLKYRSSRKDAELHQAWDLYYHVFKKINKQLHALTQLELQYVAPALVRAQVRGWCAPLAAGEHGAAVPAGRECCSWLGLPRAREQGLWTIWEWWWCTPHTASLEAAAAAASS